MELDKVKSLISKTAKKNDCSIQTMWDTFFFERFLYRLSISEYYNMFIFKGGFLLQNIFGINERSTMYIDFKIVNSILSEEQLYDIFTNICKIEVNDNINYAIVNISNIRAETKYGGKTIKVEAKFYNIKKRFSIDIGVGDVITPYPIKYKFNSIIFDDSFDLFAYPVETVISEKFETLISKSTKNSRIKDIVDIYLLERNGYDKELLNTAIINTFYLRETNYDAAYIKSIINAICENEHIKFLFENYKSKHSFVKDLTLEMCFNAINKIYNDLIFLNKINLNEYKLQIHLLKYEEYVSCMKIDDDYDEIILSNSNINIELSDKQNNNLKSNIIISTNLKLSKNYLDIEESIDFYKRISNEFHDILSKYENKKILIITDLAVITAIKSIVYGYPYSDKLKISYEKIVKLK